MKRLGVAALLLTCLTLGQSGLAADLNPEQALERLKQGNDRYMDGRTTHARAESARRQQATPAALKPIAAVLACADAPTPPQIIFDTTFADLYVIHIAGNICDTSETASIEYAINNLGAPLVVVLGHGQCAAVQTAIDNKNVVGGMKQISQKIQPSVKEACTGSTAPADCLRLAVQHNVYHSMSDLFQQSELVRQAVSAGKLKVVGAVRDQRNGHVDWLGQHPLQDELLKGAPNAVPASSLP